MLCAVDRAGSTSCFGANDDRAILTNGSTTPTWLPPRLQAVRLSGPAATLALDGSLDGYGTGCVLTRDGTISCFTIERRAPD